jgi:hypothetical protein
VSTRTTSVEVTYDSDGTDNGPDNGPGISALMALSLLQQCRDGMGIPLASAILIIDTRLDGQPYRIRVESTQEGTE